MEVDEWPDSLLERGSGRERSVDVGTRTSVRGDDTTRHNLRAVTVNESALDSGLGRSDANHVRLGAPAHK